MSQTIVLLHQSNDIGYVFFSSRRRHTRYWRDWSSDVCSSDLVQAHVADPLAVPGGLPLHPVLAPAARPVGGPAGGEGAAQRLVVHPRDHEHLAGVVLLDDGGDQTGGGRGAGRGGPGGAGGGGGA